MIETVKEFAEKKNQESPTQITRNNAKAGRMHLESITKLFRNKNETIYKQIPFVLFLLNSNLTEEIFFHFLTYNMLNFIRI